MLISEGGYDDGGSMRIFFLSLAFCPILVARASAIRKYELPGEDSDGALAPAIMMGQKASQKLKILMLVSFINMSAL